MEIKFVKTHKESKLPKKNNDGDLTGDACYDIFSVEGIVIGAKSSTVIKTGLKLGYVTPGYWIRIEGRSGLGFKNSIVPHFGVIDNPYRGDFSIKLFNLSDKNVSIEKGKAIAQFSIQRMISADIEWIDESEVKSTDRGEQGFGSSDITRKLISHESPLSLLRESRTYNDYDYALVHLFETHLYYYNFFKESLSMGRRIILDNSIFELGKAFDMDRFAYWIEKLKPTEYIIPDALNDKEKTISQLNKWMNEYSHLPGIKIGVVQGKTINEIIDCYKAIDRYCDKIAIGFDCSYYDSMNSNEHQEIRWMKGRQELISYLLTTGVINTEKKHHLLGASLPQEFDFYKDKKFNFIETIDTSNPIVHGLKGIKYKDGKLMEKERIKLVDLLECKPSKKQLDDIKYNIQEFKKII